MPITDSNTNAEKEQPQALQTVTDVPQYAQPFEDDTIDLYELLITLWNKKWLVIAVTAIAALGSVVYALQQPPIYKAEALLLPPGTKDIQSLNFPGVQEVNPDGVFAEFKKNLMSRNLQKKFILEYGLMDLLAPERTTETSDEDIFALFAGQIEIGTENEKENTSLYIEQQDAEIASQLVNDLIKFIDTETILLLVGNIRNSIANQIRDIEYTIGSKRQMAKLLREDQTNEIEYTIASKRQLAKTRREDKIKEIEYTIASKRQMVKQRREDEIEEIKGTIKSRREMASLRRIDKITRYEEAAKTANLLGIMTGLTQQMKLVEDSAVVINPLISRDPSTSAASLQRNVDITAAPTPLFFIGYDALNAELDNLKSRTDEDPFIPGLRDLQESLSRLRSVSYTHLTLPTKA